MPHKAAARDLIRPGPRRPARGTPPRRIFRCRRRRRRRNRIGSVPLASRILQAARVRLPIPSIHHDESIRHEKAP